MPTVAQPHRLASRLINGILAIKPLFGLAKYQARQMMIKRAETIGVPWTQNAAALQARDWTAEFGQVHNPNLIYPDYYLKPFHAYSEGNLGWDPATEAESAAAAVHAKIWPEAGAQGDARLRQSYHAVLLAHLPSAPQTILDLGCSVGMSTLALQATFPDAQITGVDLSPYFLAVAQLRSQSAPSPPHWLHAPAEATGLPDAAFDLISACLMFHELPSPAAIAILQEARRLLRPGGHLAIMDMNPQSATFAQMPPFILTLLKSTEPYLDEYFALDIESALMTTGFAPPTITANSPRHRTIIATPISC
jgi:SAM-dependent methyltransferase